MRRNLRRTVLTVLTIALATFTFTVLISVPASMDRLVRDASTGLRLVVNNRTAPWGGLPARYCDEIRPLPGAAACVALTGWVANYRDVSDPIQAFAAGPDAKGEFFPSFAQKRITFTLAVRCSASWTPSASSYAEHGSHLWRERGSELPSRQNPHASQAQASVMP
jgi:hypothetical protein